MPPLIRVESVFKIYRVGDIEVVALQGLDLEIAAGEVVAIIGASGSGKSTLLNMIGGLDLPSAGRVTIGERDLLRMSERDLADYRRRSVGFLWQQPSRNLLPYLTAADNIELPMLLAGEPSGKRRARVSELLASVGMAGRGGHKPDRLSGGEQQRIAAAITLALNPPLVLADEPTGELDTANAEHMMELFGRLARDSGTTFVIVTHDPAVAARTDRIIQIRDGRVSAESVKAASREVIDFVVVDANGRLQIPSQLLDELGVKSRARVGLSGDHIGIWPVSE